jgi:type I restriction enzyme S subunit
MNNLVPEGWFSKSIGEFDFDISDGNYSSKYPKQSDFISVGIPFIRANNIKNHTVVSCDMRFISQEQHADLKKGHLKKGDILISTRGDIGQIAKVPSKFVGANINAQLVRINTKGQLHADYLLQFMLFDKTKFAIKELETGTALKQLPVGKLKQLSVIFPPLPEQQKIAAILTSVDQVIEQTQAQIDKLKDLKTAMMQELLTCGVGVDGKPHREFKVSPVGRIPMGWKVKPLAKVVEHVIDCEHKTAPYVEKSEYMVVRTSNVRNGELVLEDMKYTHADGYSEWTKRAVPSSGDVMFTREAPAGESCLVPDDLSVCLGQRMVLLRPNTDVVLPCFFSLFLTSAAAVKSIYDLSIGTTVSRINIEDIKKIPCILPTLDEQLKISNSILSVQKLLSVKLNKLKSLNKNKKALMQDLLTGKVRVTVPSSPKAFRLKASPHKAIA